MYNTSLWIHSIGESAETLNFRHLDNSLKPNKVVKALHFDEVDSEDDHDPQDESDHHPGIVHETKDFSL